MNKEALIPEKVLLAQELEKKLRGKIQEELMLLHTRIFSEVDLILYSAITGVDVSKKLAEILIEETELLLK